MDDDLRRAYARHLAAPATPGRESCVPPEALLALVERRGGERDRLATLDHAAACDACRRDLELLRSVHHAGETRVRRAARRWRGWAPASRARLAAAAVIILAIGGVAGLLLHPRDAAMRGGGPTVTLVAPAGSVAAGEPVTLTWRAVAGADRYQVELLGVSGDSLFAAATRDTVLTVPGGVALEAGSEYLWSVRAVRHDGTHAVSEPLRFRLR
jgi:hypothetical protein